MAGAITTPETSRKTAIFRIRLTALALGAVLALSACVSAPAETPPQDRARSAASAPQKAADKEQLAVLQQGLRAPITTPVPRIEGLSARINGMLRDDVIKLIGEPSFRRRDDPAEIWQYRGRRCILDVFLFKTSETVRVNHVELRTTSVARPADPDCYADIFGRRPFPRKG